MAIVFSTERLADDYTVMLKQLIDNSISYYTTSQHYEHRNVSMVGQR